MLASIRNSTIFEHALTGIVIDANARAIAVARQAEDLNDTARIGLIAFSGLTLVLAGLLIGLTVRTLRANTRLLDRLSHLAQEDGLTGIANRRTLDEALPPEFARSLRSGQPLTVVMMDIDHFKRYNDRRGHAAGDALLRGAAQGWRKQMRPTDLLARYGGEEFTLVLPGCNADQAAQLIERLRPLVPDHQTFSAGIAAWEGHESDTELMQRADRALLAAKKAAATARWSRAANCRRHCRSKSRQRHEAAHPRGRGRAGDRRHDRLCAGDRWVRTALVRDRRRRAGRPRAPATSRWRCSTSGCRI